MDKHIHIHRSRFLLVLLLRDFNRAKPESACSTDRDIEIGRRRIWPTLTISCENLVSVSSKLFSQAGTQSLIRQSERLGIFALQEEERHFVFIASDHQRLVT